ncbi:MAG: hypothetical protein LIO91_03725 [Bacteroidales bacterium]|nr:hypothetical protein [Bacteroidales bacterium]
MINNWTIRRFNAKYQGLNLRVLDYLNSANYTICNIDNSAESSSNLTLTVKDEQGTQTTIELGQGAIEEFEMFGETAKWERAKNGHQYKVRYIVNR